MTITPSLSNRPQKCWRCRTLGLTDAVIAPGEAFFLLSKHGEQEDAEDEVSCPDCLRRLADEIMEASE